MPFTKPVLFIKPVKPVSPMKTPFLVPALALLMACGGKTKTSSTDATTTTASVADLPEAESSGPGAGKCLLTYQTKMDEALPLATIKKHYTGDMSKAELDYTKSEKYANRDTYKYEIATGKTITHEFNGMKVNVPEMYEIGLAWIEEIEEKYHPDAKARFLQMYRTPTPEELAKTKAYLDKQLGEKMAEKGMTSKAEKKAGKDVAGGIMNRKIEFQQFLGLGDAASWSVPENELHVLAGRTEFRVIANAGPDNTANLELAKKLAADVLAKCK